MDSVFFLFLFSRYFSFNEWTVYKSDDIFPSFTSLYLQARTKEFATFVNKGRLEKPDDALPSETAFVSPADKLALLNEELDEDQTNDVSGT